MSKKGLKMKSILIIFAMILTSEAMAVCSSPIARTNLGNVVLTATRYNTDLNTAYTRVNELPGDCITDETITSAKIDDGTIVNADISNTTITNAKLAALNYAISASSSGSFTTTSASAVDVTNLSVSITTSGRPIVAELIPVGASDLCQIGYSDLVNSTAGATFYLLKDATVVYTTGGAFDAAGATTISINIPNGAFFAFDTPAAGTYTYKVQARADFAATAKVTQCKLIVREI